MKSIVLMTSLVLLAAGCAKESSTSTGAAGSPGATGATAGSQLSSQDAKFLTQAAQAGMADLRMGQLMAQNGADPAVKSLGQRIVDDHTKLNEQLNQLAAQKGVTVPTQLGGSDQKMVERLAGLSGAEFDQAAQKDAVRDHEKAIELFQNAAQNSQDPDIKAFAQKALPTLQEHLNAAKKLSTAPANQSQGGTSSPGGTSSSEGTSSQSGTSSQP